MKTKSLLLFFLSFQLLLLPSSSSSSADLYRSHVIDHFLQKAGRLDTFFTENSLGTKESTKRNAGAGTVNAINNDYLRSKENYPHSGKYSGMNVYEYPETQSPTYRYNLPSSNIYRGSSSISYQGSPATPSYHGILKDTQPQPTTSPSLRSFFPSLITQTPSFQPSFPTPLAQSQHSPPVPFQHSPAPRQPHHPTSPPSLYQSFFDATPSSVNIQSPTSPPQIPGFSTPVDPSNLFHSTPVDPSNLFHSSHHPVMPATSDSSAKFVMKPFTFFNIPQKQGTNEAKLHQTQPQTSYFQDSISKKQQTNQISSSPMSFDPKTFQHNEETNQPIPIPRLQLDQEAISQPSLFESINQAAPDREVRKKQTQTQRKMPKSNALEALMSIAGENWEQKLLTGVDNLSGESSDSFLCPEPEGHFPSPSSCSVYYQCAQGTAHKHTCQEGLAWNIKTLQCDWLERVDCGLDSGYSTP